MSKTLERHHAQRLRKMGTSIADIAKQLAVSKSTVSYWCRDIVLSKKARQKIVYASNRKSTAGILHYTEGLRQKRLIETQTDAVSGAKMIGRLSERDVLCVGLGLYWGEGYKRGSQEFGFTNSDFSMINFYIQWLKICFAIKEADLILRISINELHKHRVSEVESCWSMKTGIPLGQFTKTSLIKVVSKKVYSNQSEHFGTLRIKVRRGTRLRRQVLGAIASISSKKAE
jgi:hypothetical protein